MTSNDGKMMIDSTFINEDGKVSVRVDSFMIHPRNYERNGEFRHIRRERMMARNNADASAITGAIHIRA